MASQVPPKKNAQYTFWINLIDQTNTLVFKSSPTLAAGDFKVDIDGAGLNNLGTLPTVTPAASKLVKVVLANTEMNGDNINFLGSDPDNEWCDIGINIQTTTQQIDDLSRSTDVVAIKAQTDQLGFSAAGNVKADIKEVNDVTVNGTGHPGNEWGP